jgi:hypothetical protein
MNYRSLRILACAGALLSLLTFTTPAQAAGWTHSVPNGGILQAAWAWIMGVWTAGDHGLGIGPDGLSKSDRNMGIDPDGKPSSATMSTCSTNCERSSGIAPNG